MSTMTLTIKTAVNGFTLEYRDPEVEAENKGDGLWVDPYKTVVCKTLADVSTVVAAILPTMTLDEEEDNSADEFKVAFKQAIKELA